ncbi:MAG: permease-like cell division protein FtsX [Merdibacter sp.]
MKKRMQNLLAHLADAWRNLIRHISLTFSSATAVTVTLLIVGLLVLIAGNINSFTNNIEQDFQIQATISPGVSEEKEQREELRTQIEALDGVSCTFSSKEAELQQLIEQNGEMFSYYEGEDRNPLYDVFLIELDDPQQIESLCTTLEDMDGIVSASYGGDGITVMVDIFEGLRLGGGIFVVFLGLLAVLLIKNTIKITIQARQEEIAIMRNVGASNWYIRMPFIIEGMYIGILGALVPIVLVCGGYYLVYEALGGIFLSSMFVMVDVWPFAVLVGVLILLIGMAVGMIGSSFAVGKYLRWKR